jgi:hypothetical protein
VGGVGKLDKACTRQVPRQPLSRLRAARARHARRE